MIQGITDKPWQAEARTAETKQFIRDIKRITRRKFTAEEKIRIVLEGFRRDTPIRDLCRREGIRPSTYYAWLKDFMEAGKESGRRQLLLPVDDNYICRFPSFRLWSFLLSGLRCWAAVVR